MRIITAVGLTGGFFVAWQMWTRQRAALHADLLQSERVTPSAVAIEAARITPPTRMLNVNNFGLDELNGKKGGSNSVRIA